MTTHYLKQCRPDAEETAYLWKLFHAAQRVEDRWGSWLPEISDELSYCPNMRREQKFFLLRAWQVLVDDKGGFGRFMGTFDTYVHNVQDPDDDCVAYKPELKRYIEDGLLFDTLLEAYREAGETIASVLIGVDLAVMPSPNWISCKDRMPEEHIALLVCQEGGIIFCAEYESGCFYPDEFPNVPKEGREITHWMPLPAAPKVNE